MFHSAAVSAAVDPPSLANPLRKAFLFAMFSVRSVSALIPFLHSLEKSLSTAIKSPLQIRYNVLHSTTSHCITTPHYIALQCSTFSFALTLHQHLEWHWHLHLHLHTRRHARGHPSRKQWQYVCTCAGQAFAEASICCASLVCAFAHTCTL